MDIWKEMEHFVTRVLYWNEDDMKGFGKWDEY